MKKRDVYEGSKPTRPKQPATRPKQPAQSEPNVHDDEPTLVRCPTCVAFDVPKLGCHLCKGSGFISYEQYTMLTVRCPTCVGSGRIPKDQSDALDIDAKRRESSG